MGLGARKHGAWGGKKLARGVRQRSAETEADPTEHWPLIYGRTGLPNHRLPRPATTGYPYFVRLTVCLNLRTAKLSSIEVSDPDVWRASSKTSATISPLR
jgi:hypothetical protein